MKKNASKYNLGGRPVAFSSPKAMAAKIEDYFTQQEHVYLFTTKDGDPVYGQGSINVQGMCAYLGITTQTLNEYAKNDRYKSIIAQAKQICEAYLVDRCCMSKDHKADFVLKNGYKASWTESAEPETPVKLLVEYVSANNSKETKTKEDSDDTVRPS